MTRNSQNDPHIALFRGQPHGAAHAECQEDEVRPSEHLVRPTLRAKAGSQHISTKTNELKNRRAYSSIVRNGASATNRSHKPSL
jgi:hypothetical protein